MSKHRIFRLYLLPCSFAFVTPSKTSNNRSFRLKSLTHLIRIGKRKLQPLPKVLNFAHLGWKRWCSGHDASNSDWKEKIGACWRSRYFRAKEKFHEYAGQWTVTVIMKRVNLKGSGWNRIKIFHNFFFGYFNDKEHVRIKIVERDVDFNRFHFGFISIFQFNFTLFIPVIKCDFKLIFIKSRHD